VVLTALVVIASGCITDGAWTSSAPAAVSLNPAFSPDLVDVSCPTATFCMAVGGASQHAVETGTTDVPVVQTWDGSSWSEVAFTLGGVGGSGLERVSCASAISCFVVYAYWGEPLTLFDRIGHWDGTTWSVVPVETYFATGPSPAECASDGTCVIAVSGEDTLVWNGTGYVTAPGSSVPDLGGIGCATAGNCWATDLYGGGAYHRDGTSWAFSALPVPPAPPGAPATSPRFQGASMVCTTGSWCLSVGATVAGSNRAPLAARWNGSVWAYQAVPSPTRGA
jgi:hypothetical protein